MSMDYKNEKAFGYDFQPKKRGSNIEVFFSIVCIVSVGSPAAMGFVFRLGGWISALWIIITCLVAWYTGVLLVECLYYKKGERLQSFPDIGEAAFGPVGRTTLQIFHYSILLSVSALFIKLAGITLHIVTNYYSSVISVEICTIVVAVFIAIPYSVANDMEEMKFISILGLITAISTVVVASTLGFIEKSILPLPETKLISWEGIPSALGTIGFAFGGNVIFPHIEAKMSNPSQWKLTLGLPLATVAVFYLIVGLANYSLYGNNTINPIFEVLKPGLTNNILCLLVSGHIICAIPFYLISFSSETEQSLHIRKKMSKISFKVFQIFSHIILVIFLTLLAIFVPHFEVFMAMIGSISNLILVYITPIVLHLKLLGLNRPWIQYFPIIVCCCLGIPGGLMGIYISAKDMFKLI